MLGGTALGRSDQDLLNQMQFKAISLEASIANDMVLVVGQGLWNNAIFSVLHLKIQDPFTSIPLGEKDPNYKRISGGSSKYVKKMKNEYNYKE